MSFCMWCFDVFPDGINGQDSRLKDFKVLQSYDEEHMSSASPLLLPKDVRFSRALCFLSADGAGLRKSNS